MLERPTILIPISDGMVARNILRTDTLRALKEAGLRIVVLPPKGKAEYYEKEFGDEQVIIEKEPIWRHTYGEFLLTELFLHSIPTNFMRIRQRDWYLAKGQYGRYALASFVRLLGYIRLWHHVLRAIDAMIPVPHYLDAIFKKWEPDLVFAPTMIMRDEIMLMRLARRRGKKTIGMFKSWDNPTSKAFLRFFPDTIICHTEILKGEALRLYGYPNEK
ncbi:MAG TPA: hypothetical protein VGQ55_00510, partial [Pyrinomonadaceae bacterium]|nr:hypothetical protein [Pyrinomonadaceae bacterium]